MLSAEPEAPDFEAFARGQVDRAVRLAWRMLGPDHRSAAEDVVQDAFEAAFRGLGRFRGDAKLETWFYRILVRKIFNQRRWGGLRSRLHRDVAVEDVASEVVPAADALAVARIDRALAGLTDGQRDAFVLVHLEGFTSQEAAQALGKAQGTIKSHLHRARTALRNQLTEFQP